MILKKGYMIFTNKDHPGKGIMSTILGILSILTFIVAVYLSYMADGVSSERYGTAGLFASLFMFIGLGLGVWSFSEKDKFKLFPILGILFNLIAFFILSLILYAGAYVK